LRQGIAKVLICDVDDVRTTGCDLVDAVLGDVKANDFQARLPGSDTERKPHIPKADNSGGPIAIAE
jgi:hypothetical protein